MITLVGRVRNATGVEITCLPFGRGRLDQRRVYERGESCFCVSLSSQSAQQMAAGSRRYSLAAVYRCPPIAASVKDYRVSRRRCLTAMTVERTLDVQKRDPFMFKCIKASSFFNRKRVLFCNRTGVRLCCTQEKFHVTHKTNNNQLARAV